MLQPEHVQSAAGAASEAVEKFNAGTVIMEHVSNSPIDHPLIQLPVVYGIDFSVTKHVLMLWLVSAIVFLLVTFTVRRYIRQDRLIPSGLMNALEAVVEFIRDSVAEPNVGRKWVRTWTPLLLSLFVFILAANAAGLIPVFDALSLFNYAAFHASEQSFLARMLHGGTTATGNYNVTAGLATVTFFAIIFAGTWAHGFTQHWKNLVPHGVPVWLYPLMIPLEVLSMLVRPFALTMRLAANMTGGHIAILAILSFVFLFAELSGRALVGVGVGVPSMVLAALIWGLEIVIVLVQAYVFTLLSAVFIGMAIHAHH